MVRVSGKIRRLLVDAGLVSDEDWAAARERGGQPVATLLSQGAISESALLETLGSAAGVAPVDMTRMRPDPQALAMIPQDVCQEHGILPLAKNGDILTIVVSDPFDVLLLDDLKRMTRCNVRTVLSHPAAIKTATDTLFDSGSRAVDDLLGEVGAANELEVAVEREQENIEAQAVSSEDAPAV